MACTCGFLIHFVFFVFLLRVPSQNSASYWEGKATAESLQRIYGISFPDNKRVLYCTVLYVVAGLFPHLLEEGCEIVYLPDGLCIAVAERVEDTARGSCQKGPQEDWTGETSCLTQKQKNERLKMVLWLERMHTIYKRKYWRGVNLGD